MAQVFFHLAVCLALMAVVTGCGVIATHRASRSKRITPPVTLLRWCRSFFSITFFVIGTLFVLVPFTWIYFHIGGTHEHRRLCYHRLLCAISRFIIHHVPGTAFCVSNPTGEDFHRQAVIVCNHQSHLDLMAIMMLTPKLVILTNDWVWHNPFYGYLIRCAEFYPVSDGFEANLERLRDLVRRGYSVAIFPEGTRSPDGAIHRFHQGAFWLASRLQMEILPLCLHGFGDVLPKTDFMLRPGSMHLEIGQRISPPDMSDAQAIRRLRHDVSKQYASWYADICSRRQTMAYFVPYIRLLYAFQPWRVRRALRHELSCLAQEEAALAKRECEHVPGSIVLFNSGVGALALAYALTHPECAVTAVSINAEDARRARTLATGRSRLLFLSAEEFYLSPVQADAFYCRFPLSGVDIPLSWKAFRPVMLEECHES